MYFLTEIRSDDFGKEPHELAPNRLKLVSQCSDPTDRGSATVFTSISKFEKADQRAAILGLAHFVKLAQMGSPFSELVDKKTVHEAFEAFHCTVTNKKEKVWRYRHGVIRILFYYAADRVVLLPTVLVKRTDKLSIKEIQFAQTSVVKFLEASQSSSGLQWVKDDEDSDT
jgi:mRNA-degrading endonuclease RelE of RelBE toxin-antitoxin system